MNIVEDMLNRSDGKSKRAAAQASEAPQADPQDFQSSILRTSGDIIVDVNGEGLFGAGVLRRDGDAHRLAEELRCIKRPVVENAFGRRETPPVSRGNLVMIASSLPDEGKSFMCINLAKSLAMETDLNVLLVDGDTSKRCLSSGFGLQERLGLTDVLVNKEIDLLSAIVRTDMEHLFVLPAGKARTDVTELLSGARMANLISMLSNWDNLIVIFDSAPLLLTVESRALASLVGQIILVVRAGKTKQEDVLEAANMIEGDKPINLVLNQLSTPAKNGMYYGAYYPPATAHPLGPPPES